MGYVLGRFTSARAESTRIGPCRRERRPVHLRLPGEDISMAIRTSGFCGAPRPARRAHTAREAIAAYRRLTSACVESTGWTPTTSRPAPAHLRSRGENRAALPRMPERRAPACT
ncbi:hypothetical protein Scani_00550 [Streptomyces caniferus]|uniref:Uncharacterized protein n=1 Tax=Streptomyces caniferus TaxID=285557 RepID=A0A640RYZ2_9ACTN|nr:hypothetical protein Scani_00550 [Streptomyces caniferus]